MVGVTGLEPVTLRLSSACSNQLSYTPPNSGLSSRSSQHSNLVCAQPPAFVALCGILARYFSWSEKWWA